MTLVTKDGTENVTYVDPQPEEPEETGAECHEDEPTGHAAGHETDLVSYAWCEEQEEADEAVGARFEF
jgi:hypothetical protein